MNIPNIHDGWLTLQRDSWTSKERLQIRFGTGSEAPVHTWFPNACVIHPWWHITQKPQPIRPFQGSEGPSEGPSEGTGAEHDVDMLVLLDHRPTPLNFAFGAR